MTNEEKARELAFESPQCQMYIDNKCNQNFACDRFKVALEMAEWKDEQYKQDNSNFINYLKKWAQGWLIEQLTAFAVHLQKRGAFRDDLCMDFEHEAQSFIEMQNNKEL